MAEREQHPQQQPKAEKYQKPEKELKQLVRVVNTDLDGARSVFLELSKVKGVGFSFAHAVCTVLNIDKSAVLGSLDDKKFSQIEEVIKNPEKFNIPQWMLNRRREYETGESHHLVTTDIGLAEDNDMKFFMQNLRDVVDAQGGIGKLAKQTGLSRTTLYKTLSEDGNPEVATLKAILDVYNLQISIIPKRDRGRKKAA